MKIDEDSAKIKFPPPLILLTCLIIGFGLNSIFHQSVVPEGMQMWLGISLLVIGIVIILSAAGLFRKAGTDVKPWKSTTKIVTSGIYKITRNPMYLAMALIGLGISIWVNSLTMVLMILVFVGIINYYVIKREECYLEAKFGDEYNNYRHRTRRWI